MLVEAREGCWILSFITLSYSLGIGSSTEHGARMAASNPDSALHRAGVTCMSIPGFICGELNLRSPVCAASVITHEAIPPAAKTERCVRGDMWLSP